MKLTVSQCARLTGTSNNYILSNIRKGNLSAETTETGRYIVNEEELREFHFLYTRAPKSDVLSYDCEQFNVRLEMLRFTMMRKRKERLKI